MNLPAAGFAELYTDTIISHRSTASLLASDIVLKGFIAMCRTRIDEVDAKIANIDTNSVTAPAAPATR